MTMGIQDQPCSFLGRGTKTFLPEVDMVPNADAEEKRSTPFFVRCLDFRFAQTCMFYRVCLALKIFLRTVGSLERERLC
jgi:hypothetical protein